MERWSRWSPTHSPRVLARPLHKIHHNLLSIPLKSFLQLRIRSPLVLIYRLVGLLPPVFGCCCGGTSPPAGGQRLLPAERSSPGAGGSTTAAVADVGFMAAGVPAAAHPLLSSPPSRKGGAGLGASMASSSGLLASPGRPTLSPDAASFFPGHLSAGRSKRLRWEDDSLSGDSGLERSPSPSLLAARLTRSGAAPSSTGAPPMAVAATAVAAIQVPWRRRQR